MGVGMVGVPGLLSVIVIVMEVTIPTVIFPLKHSTPPEAS